MSAPCRKPSQVSARGVLTLTCDTVARGAAAGIVINPGGYTHGSVAILDALLLSELPVVEVHISNIFRREPFRADSYISRGATGMITGLGTHGYVLALDAIAEIIATGSDG